MQLSSWPHIHFNLKQSSPVCSASVCLSFSLCILPQLVALCVCHTHSPQPNPPLQCMLQLSLTVFLQPYYISSIPPPPSSSLVRHREFVTLLTYWESELDGKERRDSPSLNISKGSDPQHDPIICPQPLILHFTLSDVLSQGPPWLSFPLSLMGIRDSLLVEVVITVAVSLSADFKSVH